MNSYFIAIYTNEVKDYCDKKFFNRVHKLSRGNPVRVVDNTIGYSYFQKLTFMFKDYENFKGYHLDVPEKPKRDQFQRNVTDSVQFLRQMFLETDLPYFLIIESDVLPPVDLLDKFDESIEKMNSFDNHATSEFTLGDNKIWGIVGGYYYDGFHKAYLDGVHPTHHCLSGCTVYKRELIEKYPFRYDPDNLGPFPDAWICYDSGKEYDFYDNYDIRCDHLATNYGIRRSKAL